MSLIYLDSDEWEAILTAMKQERKQVNPKEIEYIKWLDVIITKIEIFLKGAQP